MTEEKRKRFSPPTDAYKPRFMTQEDMQNSLKGLSKKTQEQSRPLETNPKTIINRATQGYPSPRFGRPHKPFSWTGREQKPLIQQQLPIEYEEKKQEEVEEKTQDEAEEEPYWNPQEWEQWALDLYNSYPETRKFLPEWFLKAAEEGQQ